MVAYKAHNLMVAGSTPAAATVENKVCFIYLVFKRHFDLLDVVITVACESGFMYLYLVFSLY